MEQLSTRNSPRVDYHASLLLRPQDRGAVPIPAHALNLSAGGLFVSGQTVLGAGTRVEFALPLPEATAPLCGRVVWCRQENAPPARPRGMGIRFVELSPESARLLARTVTQLPQQRQEVKLSFETVAPPIRAKGVVTPEGIRLTTKLPFLRLDSAVKVGTRAGRTDGTIRGVALAVSREDGVPRLQIDVGFDRAGLAARPGNANKVASGAFESQPALPVELVTEPSVEVEALDEAVGTREVLAPRRERSRLRALVLSVGLAGAGAITLALWQGSRPAAPPRPAAARAVTPARVAGSTRGELARQRPQGAVDARPRPTGAASRKATTAEKAPAAPAALRVTLDGPRGRLELGFSATVENAEVYPLASPPGVGLWLPDGTVALAAGRHALRQGPFGSLLVRRSKRGTRVLLFFSRGRQQRYSTELRDGRAIIEAAP